MDLEREKQVDSVSSSPKYELNAKY